MKKRRLNYKFEFAHEKPEKPERNFFIGAIDIETPGTLGGDANYVTMFHENLEKPVGFKSKDDALDYVFSLDTQMLAATVWFSHNGEFDWSRLVTYFEKNKDKYVVHAIERMEGKFFQFTIKDHDGKAVTVWRDSNALYPRTLKEFAADFAPDHPKGDTPMPFDPDNEEHQKYALNDVKCLVVALQNFDTELYKLFSVHIKGTTAATAFAACKRFLPEGDLYQRTKPQAEGFFRLCYYGGRVQLNGLRHQWDCSVASFDINSSYPAQMRLGVPKGQPLWTQEYQHGKPGFYICVVTVPETIALPPVPHKSERDELSFPWGTFRTQISSIEIDYLVSLGGTVEVEEGYYFPMGLCHPFSDFVDLCEKTRARFKKTPTEAVIKLIQNSLYGKFGTRPEGRLVIVSYEGFIPKDYSMLFDPDGNGEPIPNMFWKDNPKDVAYMLPHWAAWITAQARLSLDRYIRIAGAKNVLYIDTDSIKTTPEGTARILAAQEIIGPVYGQLKFEENYETFIALAPKCYAGIVNGKPKFAYKGIPAKMIIPKGATTSANFRAIHNGEQVEVEWEAATSFTTYARSGKRGVIRRRKTTEVGNVYSHRLVGNFWVPRLAELVENVTA